MGQVHHGSATTTAAIHRAIQCSQDRLRQLAARSHINPKPVASPPSRSSAKPGQTTRPCSCMTCTIKLRDQTPVRQDRSHPGRRAWCARCRAIAHRGQDGRQRCVRRSAAPAPWPPRVFSWPSSFLDFASGMGTAGPPPERCCIRRPRALHRRKFWSPQMSRSWM